MRKMLLVSVLIIAYYLPAFSQLYNRTQSYRLHIDKTFSNLSLKNKLTTPNLVNPFDTNWFFNNSTYNKKLMFQGLTDINSKPDQDLTAIFNLPPASGNMPCALPQGYFPMPIVEPDTTVRYTLLIKKY